MRIPICHLVPDLFLTDLPHHLKCESRELLFDPANPVALSDSGRCLVRGSGGEEAMVDAGFGGRERVIYCK